MNISFTKKEFSRLEFYPNIFTFAFHFQIHADVAKLVDALDLGSSAARYGGSSPFIRT
jgi:hypothetical protein